MKQIQQLQAEQDMIEKVESGRKSMPEERQLVESEDIEPQELDAETILEHQ